MRAEAVKFQHIGLKFAVDQYEIGSNMAVAKAIPFSAKCVVAVLWGQGEVRASISMRGCNSSCNGVGWPFWTRLKSFLNREVKLIVRIQLPEQVGDVLYSCNVAA